MLVEWLLKKRRKRRGKTFGETPTVIKNFNGNPYTLSAKHGVSGFNGKVDIKFEGEINHFMRELVAMKEVAAAKEK